MYSCSVANYERERVKLASDCETKIEQLEKKVKNDVDHEKEEKEKALAKVWQATLIASFPSNVIGWRQTLTTSPANHIRVLLVRAKKVKDRLYGLDLRPF